MPARKPKIIIEPKLKRSAVRTRKQVTSTEAVAAVEAPSAEPVEPLSPPANATKLDRVIALLSRGEGATIAQMVELTGWKARSVRGFMAGALKAKRGIVITSAKAGGVRTYRIEAP